MEINQIEINQIENNQIENNQIEINQTKHTNKKTTNKKKLHNDRNLHYKNGKLVNISGHIKKISDKEQDEIYKRITHLVKNKVNFISGTVAPATSSKRENYLNIEDLGIGFEFLSSQYDYNYTLSVQPKFMGSRCNIYLFASNLELSYAVSRNGYLISKDRVDLSSIYSKLHLKLNKWMNENSIHMIILDGELLPWAALGKGLIDNDFIPVRAGLEVEVECGKQFDFDLHYNMMKQNLNNIISENEFVKLNKKEQNKLQHHQLQTYKTYLDTISSYQTTNQMEELLKVYSKQLDLYGQDGELDYKPFSILKIIYNDGSEVIPLLDKTFSQSQMYQMLYSGDEHDAQLVLNITPTNYKSQYLILKQWFDKKTIDEGYEGIMLKPDIIQIDKLPLLKVRNQDYLTIIYGYDYKLEHNYKTLVNKKTTRRKIFQSIKEFKLGMNLLSMKYSNLDTDEYKSRLENFINCELDGNNLDPRL